MTRIRGYRGVPIGGQTANKYGAKKTTVDGHRFDSKAESEYYGVLTMRKMAGEISSIILQPRYEIEPRHIIDRTDVIAPIDYVADFEVRYPDGSVEAVDVKGKETEGFKLKAKLFRARYPDIPLVIASKDKRGGWVEKR